MHFVILGDDALLSINSLISFKDGRIEVGLRVSDRVRGLRLQGIGEGEPPIAHWVGKDNFRFIDALLHDQTEDAEGVRLGLVAKSAKTENLIQGDFSLNKDDSKQWRLILRPTEDAKRKRKDESENDRIVAAAVAESLGLGSLGMLDD